MLSRLLVDNLTVIGHAELDLGAGLTVITGETGAGKTMLAHAVRLVSGEKAEGSLVGPRGDEAYVEAEFTDRIPEVLADVADPDEPLVLARRLRRAGPARALCSGRSCSAAQLRAAADELISLTGQHAARQLVDPGVQLDLIDRAGGLLEDRADLADLHRDWRGAEKDLQELRTVLADGVRQLEMLRFEVDLVRGLDPAPGESELLEAERERLRHTDALRSASRTAAELLNAEDEGACERVALAQRELASIAEHDENIAALAAAVADAAEQLADAARSARDLSDSYEDDPGRLNDIELRLTALTDMRRRFAGLDLDSILARTAESELRLLDIEGGGEHLQGLQARVTAAASAYHDADVALAQERIIAAAQLSEATEQHLADLGLSGAKLLVEFENVEPGPRGSQRAHILLAVNQGLQPATLDKGASGGELSRVNLALLLAADAENGTWVFDEVDAGIGGDTAHIVAAKLKALSERVQVIVVTHLAQIAVVADRHLVVRKADVDGISSTSVHELSDDGSRERELARLIGADSGSQRDSKRAAELVRAGTRA